MKRILSILVALIVLLTALPVLADDTPAGPSIKIVNDKTNMSIIGSEFKAYKLFSAAYNAETAAVTFYFDADEGCIEVEYNSKKGDELIPEVEDMIGDAAAIRDFADSVYANKGATPTKTKTADAETVVIDGLTPGYYLVTVAVKNKGGDNNQSGVVSRAILVSAYNGQVTAELKVDAPSLDKQIQHNEHANDDDKGWGTVGDNQIGDTVNYRTITTVPDTEGYKVYTYVIHDKMDAGLTYNKDAMVYTDANKSDTLAGYITVDEDPEDGDTFCVTVDILQAIKDEVISAGDELYTYYSATLNKDALIYDVGHNDNVAYLQYSNDVYDTTGEKTDDTPKVKVYDWTFKFGVSKVDPDGTKLSGAKFVLSKKSGLNITYTVDEEGKETVSPTADLIAFESASDYTVSKTGTNYIINASEALLKGLDDHDTYYLYEVKEPEGYSKLSAPVTFTISSEYKDNGAARADDNPTYVANGSIYDNSDDSLTFTPDPDAMFAGIVNTSGSVLPGTGGMGTTVIYVVGGAMIVAAAALLLVMRRRESKK